MYNDITKGTSYVSPEIKLTLTLTTNRRPLYRDSLWINSTLLDDRQSKHRIQSFTIAKFPQKTTAHFKCLIKNLMCPSLPDKQMRYCIVDMNFTSNISLCEIKQKCCLGWYSTQNCFSLQCFKQCLLRL